MEINSLIITLCRRIIFFFVVVSLSNFLQARSKRFLRCLHYPLYLYEIQNIHQFEQLLNDSITYYNSIKQLSSTLQTENRGSSFLERFPFENFFKKSRLIIASKSTYCFYCYEKKFKKLHNLHNKLLQNNNELIAQASIYVQ
jgi:hypothetical protein